ncbi:hypothetical protein AAFC00_005670 [Neodothiora populina]
MSSTAVNTQVRSPATTSSPLVERSGGMGESGIQPEESHSTGPKSANGSNGNGSGSNNEDEEGERTKKRRITRACDLCNKRRVKCDGQQPCSRCAGQDVCEYQRAVFKRGKPSRSAVLERTRNAARPEHHNRPTSVNSAQSHVMHPTSTTSPEQQSDYMQNAAMAMPGLAARQHSFGAESVGPSIAHKPSMDRGSNYSSNMTLEGGLEGGMWPEQMSNMVRKHSMRPDDDYNGSQYPIDIHSGSNNSQNIGLSRNRPSFSQPLQTPGLQSVREEHMRIGFFGSNEEAIDNTSETHSGAFQFSKSTKYPVLRPVLPYVLTFLTEAQASGLLELYFSSHFNTNMHPVCKHLHAFIFRRVSVTSKENPRRCSPALLASMLWVAAETGGSEFVAWSHSKRMNVCRRLRVLTIQLLRPMVHVDLGCVSTISDVAEGRDAFSQRRVSESQLEPSLNGSSQTCGTLDDVITYIHIATITSASEEKAMSMRWWHAAFALGRELQLNKEPLSKGAESTFPGVSPTAHNPSMLEFENDPWFGLNSFDFGTGLAQFMDGGIEASESANRAGGKVGPTMDQETLEERRRTWWLLYIQDRHLALCYNRQNALLDAECEDLLLPLDEASYQSGTFLYDPVALSHRPSFPSFECTGHNVYGWFLPLMTIVGTIFDYHHLKNHHTLAKFCSDARQTHAVESQILVHLDMYSQSLVQFEQMHSSSNPMLDRNAAQDTHHTKTVVAYAKHVIDVSRVLLAGKWDPVSLFDDRDMFMTTPSFTTTIANAISAADNISCILDVDPDLSFIPYFLGIQLLQGSLPLLLIVDRLQTETDPKIIDACEVIIRATEACVSTLDTEYQRNYRQILRSAVSQSRGRYVPQKETQYRRHTVLALYRWNKGGTGLAL